MTEQQLPNNVIGSWLRRGTRYALVAALCTAVATSVTVLSAHGGDAAKVHGCVLTTPNPGNTLPLGSVRIVKAAEACKPNETAQDWNAQGIKGDTGATGATGAAGATGPAGVTGPAGPAGASPGGVYWARVSTSSPGNLSAHNGHVTGVTVNDIYYFIAFDRDMTNCAWFGTSHQLSLPDNNAAANVTLDQSNTNRLVATLELDNGDNTRNLAMSVVAHCN
jgi:hypothetical protein